MPDEAVPAPASRVDPRPASAVSHGVGIVGVIGLIAWTAIARYYGMDGPYAALVNVLACGLPMVAWSILVDKVHRRPSTGIDWSNPKPWRETIDISLVKLVGLWATWAGIALIYATGRFYWEGNFRFAMWCLGIAAPWLFLASIPYVMWLDRRLTEPRDGAWAFGAWLTHTARPEPGAIYNHLRAWAVKAFFLAFMLAIVPGGFAEFIRTPSFGILADPVRLANWLITFMFVIDVAFATVGYVLTMRPLDAHIRSANPYAPFLLMDSGGPLDYHPGTAEWTYWLQGHPLLLTMVGAVLVALTAVYAWATVAFGATVRHDCWHVEPARRKRFRRAHRAGAASGLRLQVVLQADPVDQPELLLQPVGVVFFGVMQLRGKDVAGHVIAVLLGQRDALGQRLAHAVFQGEVAAQHLRHGLARVDGLGRHVRRAFEKEDPLQQGIGMLGLLLHLVIDALVELFEPPVGVHARVQEILVARRQLAAQQLLEVIDYRCLAFHLLLPRNQSLQGGKDRG